MKTELNFFMALTASLLPFLLFAFLNGHANVKKEYRNRQYLMPVVALLYCAVHLLFLDRLTGLYAEKILQLASVWERNGFPAAAESIRSFYDSNSPYVELVLFNTLSLMLYVFLKRILTLILGRIPVRRHTIVGSVTELFYSYDDLTGRWHIKEHFGQACTFIKTAYYGSCAVSALLLLISCILCRKQWISIPFYPVFAVIIIGEMAFFTDLDRR